MELAAGIRQVVQVPVVCTALIGTRPMPELLETGVCDFWAPPVPTWPTRSGPEEGYRGQGGEPVRKCILLPQLRTEGPHGRHGHPAAPSTPKPAMRWSAATFAGGAGRKVAVIGGAAGLGGGSWPCRTSR